MYKSIKEWMTCPVTVLPFEGLNAAGDKQYGTPVDILGYIVGGVEVVNDMSGEQVTSTTQIYFDPSVCTINPEDRIQVENQEKDIISISTWYDGNTGQADIKQVFL